MAARSRRKGGNEGANGSVKISVELDADTHRRLRSLAILRESTGTEIVAGLVRREVAGVRLPSHGPDRDGDG